MALTSSCWFFFNGTICLVVNNTISNYNRAFCLYFFILFSNLSNIYQHNKAK
ncbi:hypothetical protein HMPREF3202_00513 [Prevotella bivia]|uniref:Uncharacterized protein n=1 Tax=Prevotella bivia TaxID=28125 RepID=A0A137SZS7_9BACT|nr:hypothetical protein HMPREF3202_00513 [Prevotella bivia]